ncbi:MAG: winged helix-turn-helix transcriptional regulator [Desulfovibrionaceae bacterium]|jgi:DNA-binding transcriptional ArsR family regulator|nr:winged helix-turn-helix transcriptional regulator [Desulfovibrionaceae bacterium]
MLENIISSSTRINILLRLFLNSQTRAYLRELATELKCSSGQISYELKQLSQARLLTKEKQGRQVFYKANEAHPLFPELRSMVMKALGMDRIIETVLENLGSLRLAMVIDDYAEGKDHGLIDLVLVGDIDPAYLQTLVRSAENHIKRKIRTMTLTEDEYEGLKDNLTSRPHLVLWGEKDAD